MKSFGCAIHSVHIHCTIFLIIYLRLLGDREWLRLLFRGLLPRFLGDLDLDFDLERDLELDFDLERLLAEEDVEEASSWWVEFAFRGFSATSSGRFLTASDIAASAPLVAVGRGRRGSRSSSGSGSDSGSGSGEEGSASTGTLHKERWQTNIK